MNIETPEIHLEQMKKKKNVSNHVRTADVKIVQQARTRVGGGKGGAAGRRPQLFIDRARRARWASFFTAAYLSWPLSDKF